jgi:hypothetical protein
MKKYYKIFTPICVILLVVGFVGMIISFGIVGGIRKSNEVIFGYNFADFADIFTHESDELVLYDEWTIQTPGMVEELHQQGTFVSSEPFTEVKITSLSANVLINRSADEHLTVDYSTPDKTCNFAFTEDNGVISIEQQYVLSVGFNIDWDNRSTMTIALPDKLYDIFELNMNSGQFRNQVPIQAEQLVLNITSGNIDIYDIQADVMNIDLTSGDIRGSKLHAEDFNFHMVSGNCNFLHTSAGEADFHVVSGNASVFFDHWLGDVNVDIISGFLGLYLPPDTGVKLILDRAFGEVYNEFDKIAYEDDGEYAFGGTNRQSVGVNITAGTLRFGANEDPPIAISAVG